MSKLPLGMQYSLPEKVHPETRVVLGWADWHRKNGSPVAQRIAIFRKGNRRLAVYLYPRGKCVSVTKCDATPKKRRFQEWKLSFFAVSRALKHSGWEPIHEWKEGRHECRD
jgi:hypothetical protein